jgi:hypothetical protein
LRTPLANAPERIVEIEKKIAAEDGPLDQSSGMYMELHGSLKSRAWVMHLQFE